MGRRRGLIAELQYQNAQRQRAASRAAREQQRLAAQQAREAERRRRDHEKAAAQAERERQAQHVEDQRAEAAARSRDIEERISTFEGVLVDGLTRPATISLASLKQAPPTIQFQPGRLAEPIPAPRWADFAPPQPGLISRTFASRRHVRAEQEARARYEAACAQHTDHERQRLAALEDAKRRHKAKVRKETEKVDGANARVDELAERLAREDPRAVEEYFEIVLAASPLPDELPVDVDVAYQPDPRRLLIVRELPDVDVIPTVREFKYVKTSDMIKPSPRPVREVADRYTDLIAQMILRTMRDVFDVRPTRGVDEVAVNGHVSTRDRATGRAVRPCLVSVTATRADFDELVLTDLDPSECLRHFNAIVSPHPYQLEPIPPVFDPDLDKYRLTDARQVAAGLDSRPVLLDMHPTEFEHLTRELFEAMGMKSWVTQASRDDGVDAVAVNPDPIMGGVCVVQAKRYRGVVPAEAVRALAGVMQDKRAARGVLVTTSWFGKTTHDFAARHERIQLIEGDNLVHLLKKHLGLDVLVGDLRRSSNR